MVIMPIEIPVSVWEQIQVIIVFALLLAGGAWLMVRAFSNAVAEINKHYASIVENSNNQWQRYFDAKNEKNEMVNEEVVGNLKQLTDVISRLRNDIDQHDDVMRGALDAMAEKRAKLSKVKSSNAK